MLPVTSLSHLGASDSLINLRMKLKRKNCWAGSLYISAAAWEKMKRGREKVMPLELSGKCLRCRLSLWWTSSYKPNGVCRCFRERVREPKWWKITLRKDGKKQKKSNPFLSKDCLNKADFIQLHYWIPLAAAKMAEISGRRVYHLVKGIINLSISLAEFNMSQLGHLNR